MTTVDLTRPPLPDRAAAGLGRWFDRTAVLAAAATAGLAVWAALLGRPGPDHWGAAIQAALVVVWAAVGLTVTIRRPPARLGPLVLAGAALGTVAMLAAAALPASGGGGGPGSSAVTTGAQLGRAAAAALLPMVAMHVLLGLAEGAGRVPRSALAPGYLAAVGIGVGLWTQRPEFPLWPVAVEALVAAAVGVAGAVRRYRGARGVVRQQMQCFGWAAVVGAEVAVVAVAARLLSGWPRSPGAVAAAAAVAVPVALLFAGSTRVMGRVDRLLAATVPVLGLSAMVVAVYVVVVVGLGRVPTGQDRAVLVLSSIAAAVAAGLYRPARPRLVRFSNRLVYGERQAPDQVLRTFGARLSRAVALDELLLQVAESLRQSLRLTAAEVWTGSDSRLDRTVSVPDAAVTGLALSDDEAAVISRTGVSGSAWLAIWLPQLLVGREKAVVRAAPISYSGRLLGLIVAVRPDGGDPFGPDDDTVLAELARQLGLALHNVQLDSALQASLEEVKRQAEELRASRARIIAASDGARRLIERNLHDGAQQHLVALAVNLRLARQLFEVDPDGVTELLDQLSHDIADAVQQLRDLAHGIYPPLLMDRGLGEALDAAAARASLPVDVVSDQIGRYRPEVEAAVYFCCLEALQNAAKHAGAGASARVRVWEEADSLLFEVSDDGVGFDPAGRAALGHGFVNMGDRVGAIGGAFSVTAAPGQGTAIAGRLPLSAAGRAG